MTSHRRGSGRKRTRAAKAPELCQCCGQPLGSLSVAIPASLPNDELVNSIPRDKRAERVWDNTDLCVVDHAHYYVYGSIKLAIHGHDERFSWGAWARVDEATFFWFNDEFYGDYDDDSGIAHAPFPATLATDIPFYPTPSLGLPLELHVQPRGKRPLLLLDDGDHPLVRDHRDGVPPARVGEIRAWFDALRAGRL